RPADGDGQEAGRTTVDGREPVPAPCPAMVGPVRLAAGSPPEPPGGRPTRRIPAGWRDALALLTVASVLCAAPPRGASAATISGTLTLAEHGDPVADAASAIVYFVPEGGAKAPSAPVEAEIVMRDRRFTPRAVAVPLGSSVRFPNADAIRHN